MPQTAQRRIFTATLIGAFLLGAGAQADVLTVPGGSDAPSASATSMPTRGMTMNKVEAAFGAPTDRIGPVGRPPITRWDYPGYSVFFEREHVLHTVTHPS